MTAIALATLALIAVTFIGSNVLYILSGRRLNLSVSEAIAVSYGLGIGSVSLEMLVFHMLGLRFSVDALLVPWLGLVAVNSIICFAQGGRLSQDARELGLAPNPGPAPVDVLLGCGIAFEVLYAAFRALIKPIESYDAVAIYAIRSKIFYFAKSIPADYFPSIARLFPHADYPLNIQLSETFMYMSMDCLNDALVKIIFPLFFAATLCVLYFALRRSAGRTYALVFTFILASIPHYNNYATNAYLEVPLAFYIFVGGVFLVRWIEDSSAGAMALSAVSVALAGWTKNEGLMYCAIFAALAFASVVFRFRRVSMKDIFCAFAYSGIILCVTLPWAAVKAKWGIANEEIALANLNPANLARQLPKLGAVFYELQKQLFGPKKWNIFWPAFMIALALRAKRLLRPPQAYLAAMIALALAGYALMYMISYVDVSFFASKTWARFLLDFLPLAVYLLALLLKDDVEC